MIGFNAERETRSTGTPRCRASSASSARKATIPIGPSKSTSRSRSLLGLGCVTVYDRKIPDTSKPGKIKVNGLRVVITTANDLGLAVGAELTIAHADATTQRSFDPRPGK